MQFTQGVPGDLSSYSALYYLLGTVGGDARMPALPSASFQEAI